MDHYFSICPIYYGRGQGVKLSVVFAGIFTWGDLDMVKKKIDKELTNRWLEGQAKELGLKIGHVRIES